MNIVIATGIYPPDIGGPATYTKLLAEELSAHGNTVAVVTYGEHKIPGAGFSVKYVSRKIPKGIRHIAYFWNVFKAAKNADVIFAQDPVSAGYPAMLAALFRKKKFVLKIVGDYAWEQARQRRGVADLLDDFLEKRYGARVEFIRATGKKVALRARRIIVPSRYLKSVVEKWGIEGGKISVIYNAILKNTSDAGGGKAACKRGGFIILSAGRLVPWKGFRMLISLMPELLKKREITLIIAGEGPDREGLEALRDSLNLAESVVFLGAVSKPVLASYMASSAIFALNTGYEGFSHQILEAMEAGLPIISTAAGGNKEILADGKNALVVPYNDKAAWTAGLLKLIESEELRDKLSREAKALCGNYSKEKMIANTINLLETL